MGKRAISYAMNIREKGGVVFRVYYVLGESCIGSTAQSAAHVVLLLLLLLLLLLDLKKNLENACDEVTGQQTIEYHRDSARCCHLRPDFWRHLHRFVAVRQFPYYRHRDQRAQPTSSPERAGHQYGRRRNRPHRCP